MGAGHHRRLIRGMAGRISAHLSPSVAAQGMPGAVLVDDIAYVPLRSGRFCYLACFQDKRTRRAHRLGSGAGDDSGGERLGACGAISLGAG